MLKLDGMLYLALFGPPGAGKGTQAVKIVERYHLVHLSTGDIIRREIASGSELGVMAEGLISDGKLLPDQIVMSMIRHNVKKGTGVNGFLFDGFPRTVAQAEMLDQLLHEMNGYGLDGLLSIEVEQEELVKRLLYRAKIEGRSDDSIEVIRKRFTEYESKTLPVAHYYKEQERCFTVDGNRKVEEVFESLKLIIDKIN